MARHNAFKIGHLFRRRAKTHANWPKTRKTKSKSGAGSFVMLVLTSSVFVFLVGFYAIPAHWLGGAPPQSVMDAQARLALFEKGSDSQQTVAAGDTLSAEFGFCHVGGGTNCVVDGDTFWFQGRKIRIADIDTPETHPPRCPEEERLGNAATQELHRLLNAGPFSLDSIDRDEDGYGRKLRIVTRNGSSLGGELVDAGLARWYEGGRRPWC